MPAWSASDNLSKTLCRTGWKWNDGPTQIFSCKKANMAASAAMFLSSSLQYEQAFWLMYTNSDFPSERAVSKPSYQVYLPYTGTFAPNAGVATKQKKKRIKPKRFPRIRDLIFRYRCLDHLDAAVFGGVNQRIVFMKGHAAGFIDGSCSTSRPLPGSGAPTGCGATNWTETRTYRA